MQLKYHYLFALAVLMSGCATTAKYEKVLNSWVGSPSDQLIAKWGPPSSSFPLNDGSTIYTWNHSGAPTSYTNYNQFTGQLMTTTNVPWCNTSFRVGGDGVVQNWRWEGNACRAE